MAGDWQEVLVFATVLGALAYLVRRAWRVIAAKPGRGGCASGGCGSCPAGKLAAGNIVTIGPSKRGPASESSKPAGN